ncbi:UNVERIFIED_CONTAM: hypothetical protein Scaly_1031100 [Sesamum calycinum]|uniref:CCHC-type domain-containing protein n=1 Tax=Sesamum calycinum TaxID=2727403 RepID=A0AAW2QJV8_9LAMI
MDLKLNLSSIEDEEECVVLPVQDLHSINCDNSKKLLIVGQILSHRNSNFDALKNMLQSLLQPVKGIQIRWISEDRFCLQFNHRLDMQCTLEGRPWVFNKNLSIMESMADRANLLDVWLDWSPFTMLVHDITLSFQTKTVAEHIGNKIGRFIDTEHHDDRVNWLATWKLKLSLDITKPLMRALCLENTKGDVFLVTFTYGKLPNFCYQCGVLGHISKFCPIIYEDDFVEPGEAVPFGQWLQASTQVKFNNNILSSLR